jgi:hypothetical protein
LTVGTKALLRLAIGSKALLRLAIGSKALLTVAAVNWLGLGIPESWLSTISTVRLGVDRLTIDGLGVAAVDGPRLSVDGLSVTRLTIDGLGLGVDGLRAVGRWLTIYRLGLDMRRPEAILSLSLGLAHLT